MPDMKECPKCHTKNDGSAKFCSQCGSELPDLDQHVCKNCGFENPEDAKFCVSCGESLHTTGAKSQPPHSPAAQKRKTKPKPRVVPKKRGAKQQQNQKTLNYIFAGIILIVVIALYATISKKEVKTPEAPVQAQQVYEHPTGDIALENKVYEIASKFACSCGSCGEESLDICSCPTAQRERQFIRDALQRGRSEEEVIIAVNTTYGYLKEEFQAQYGKQP